MKRNLLVLLTVLMSIVLAAAPSAADDNLLSVHGGVFMPDGNFSDTYDSMGGSLGFSFIRVNEYAGLEAALTSYYLGGDTGDYKAIGLEVLVHFMNQDLEGLQPYGAFGMNVLNTSYDYPGGTLSDMGVGLVLKAGVRYFFDVRRNEYNNEKDKYFLGVYIKRFTNAILDDRIPLNVVDLDVGGQCICFEVGIWTD